MAQKNTATATKSTGRKGSSLSHDELLELIGKEIRRSRRMQEVTQVDLAKKVGLSQSTLSKIESGLLEPSVSHWFRFCKELHLEPGLAEKWCLSERF